jgi:hypothetical protein
MNPIKDILYKWFEKKKNPLRFLTSGWFSVVLPYLYVIPLILVLLAGCEKVINVDLNESEPAVVIEGNLSQNDRTLEVKVSMTTSYFNNQPVPMVTNAEVYLENEPGFRIKANKTEPGIYQAGMLPLNVNSMYRLTVIAQNKEYTAVSYLPRLVQIDSVSCEYQVEQTFFEEGYHILLYFKDPPGEDNYYRVKLYKNGSRFDKLDKIIVFDDSRLDGKHVEVKLRGQLYEEGDTAKVELLSIDKNAWQYFSTLEDMANLNPGSPAPANPISGISNGAMGYFSAHTSSRREIIIE